MVTVEAAGDVSDFDVARKEQIAADLAASAGVDAARVRVRVEPASVLITLTILVDPSASASAVQAAVTQAMGTPLQASMLLGLTVQSVAVTTTSDDGSDGGDGGGGESGLDLGLVIGVAAGLAAVAGLAVGVACVVVRKRRRAKRPNRAYEARLHDIHLAATSQRSFPGGFKQAAVTKQGARPLGGWAAGSSGSYSPASPRRSPSAGMKTEDWLRAEQDEKRGLHTVPC